MHAAPAGPTRRGGVLQWGELAGHLHRPELPPGVVSLQEAWVPKGEDADAAPCLEARWPDLGTPPHDSACWQLLGFRGLCLMVEGLNGLSAGTDAHAHLSTGSTRAVILCAACAALLHHLHAGGWT